MDESTVLMLLTDPISSDRFAQLSFGFSLTVLQNEIIQASAVLST